MTTTATAARIAQIGKTSWDLVSISDKGGVCDHCGRTLKYVYTVRNGAGGVGADMTVGRSCCKKVTGWSLEWKEAQRLAWCAEALIRRTRNWTAFTAENPELAAHIEAEISDFEARRPNGQCGGWGHEMRFTISDNKWPDWSARSYAVQGLRHRGIRA